MSKYIVNTYYSRWERGVKKSYNPNEEIESTGFELKQLPTIFVLVNEAETPPAEDTDTEVAELKATLQSNLDGGLYTDKDKLKAVKRLLERQTSKQLVKDIEKFLKENPVVASVTDTPPAEDTRNNEGE